ncbi:TIGR02588 family protein [Oscillatoria sp. CS-180]|uniref:TIGR02588 family protein n=1 Tax=Oscillatoria sp. CS-180 TaxID=3021720 RepID=UPI00232D00BA|nr:TIGR02588 family protein [Oscillatoria sp. CS-180]MDB9526495.1 TIGR02588 family protein [Oscillatoria sp. CS-180]
MKLKESNTAPNKADPKEDAVASSWPSSIAEWTSFAIASALLLGVIALVGYLWASDQQQQPPILQVSRAEMRQSQGSFYVPFEVTNIGGETAESVQVIAELQIDGATVESGEQILKFLSSQETTEGAFVFTRNPQQGKLIIRVASYQKP